MALSEPCCSSQITDTLLATRCALRVAAFPLGVRAVLVDAAGSITAADFARLCGVRAHQVGGVVARMGVLNADGFAIVEHDVAGRRVVLHTARLVSQFGVTQ